MNLERGRRVPERANIIINKINEDKLAEAIELKMARANNQANKNRKLDQHIISNIEYKDEHLIINKGDYFKILYFKRRF